MPATSFGVAPSSECVRGEGLAWLAGAVVCLLAALWVQLCPLAFTYAFIYAFIYTLEKYLRF